ncbi:secondary thiamine-phosphate synthase enzyme YjbQ [Haloglomus litoreum]|uniref:secondary thiamine-phosphate synthase enzyme YjbQ n=1 Tax=Haloglomus litoreum TaxID=3034026 RepID=UPI0023E8CFF9|nr:secondary thiamine-phosphate synthase enzyme YjbQ [Haloglomus sp. DT116]
MRESFTVETDDRLQAIDITDRVERALPDDADGPVTVRSRHTTAGIVVNEAERRLLADIEAFLDDVVADEGWRHDEIDDNADSHLRALLCGGSETVPARDGVLDLGTWQSVLLVECDGPRTRTVELLR